MPYVHSCITPDALITKMITTKKPLFCRGFFYLTKFLQSFSLLY